MRVYVPIISEIKKAVWIYYKYPEIGTNEIMSLFGCKKKKAWQLKTVVTERMIELGVRSNGYQTVNTKIAYEVWGLDINDMKNRIEELKQLVS